jgi:hypothetical protein
MLIDFTNPVTGLAYLPKRNQPVRIDTAQLTPAAAAVLERLVAAANFFQLPATVGPTPAAPDRLIYTITVEDQGRRHTVRAVTPFENPALQELIRHLKGHAAAGPG